MQTLTREPLPYSHTFGLNTTFCHCIAASWRCSGYDTQLSTLRTRIRFADGLCICDTVCRNLEGDAQSYLYLLQNLALQLGLGQECQPEGIAIT